MSCKWMKEALHSIKFQVIIVILVVLDVGIVLFELLLDVGAFDNISCPGSINFLEQIEFCHFDRESRNICAPPAHLVLKNRFLMSDFNQTDCKCGFREGRQVCIPINEDIGLDPKAVLHSISLFILTLFTVETILKLIAFQLEFFKHKSEVFDGTIVVISWMVDIASLIEEETFQITSILIALRLWRIIKVINGTVASSKAFQRVKTEVAKLQKDNEELRDLLKQTTMETKKELDNKTGLQALEPSQDIETWNSQVMDTVTKKEPDNKIGLDPEQVMDTGT